MQVSFLFNANGLYLNNISEINNLPEIIQGGMGAGVSDWRLAKCVSQQGQVGVVSGTALDSILVRRLQLGDIDGHIRRALSCFPWPDMSQRILDEFYIPQGKSVNQPFKLLPMPQLPMKPSSVELIVASNFVEVFLAKEGHEGLIGINYLAKIQLPTLPSLFGAILAGVDFVLMGGGLPISIPGFLDGLTRLDEVKLNLHVEDNVQNHPYVYHFDPNAFCMGKTPNLMRPKFLAIVSSETAAKTLMRRATGHIDGFIVENHTAGGHNAPPRKISGHTASSLLEYSQKDIPDIQKIKLLGKPFWLAGGCASPLELKNTLNLGANGIQVGTVFAYCRESGILPEIKQEVLCRYLKGKLKVLTDFQASPTGYPFKLICIENSSRRVDPATERKRICDLGYLRHLYSIDENRVGYRCPAEPIKKFLEKGGGYDMTVGKKCLCNGLLATIGLEQIRDGGLELPIVTSGENFSFVHHMITKSNTTYGAKDVIDYLKS